MSKGYRKYRNIPTLVDGITFDSKKEAKRYQDLKLLARAQKISDLVLQPEFPIVIGDKPICKYIADFKYFDREKRCTVTEDAKGMRTPVYRLKKRLVEAQYGIRITEV